MISIELWRAKIGLFNSRRSCSRVFRLPSSSNLFAGDYKIPSVWSLGLSSSSLLKRRALVLLLVVAISHLLLSSGDVEQNPGPSRDEKPELDQLQCMCYTNKEGKVVSFRLMDRIQPKWINLAIALKFPLHKINTFKRETDPVITLLCEWLTGGDKDEDPRSVLVTWGTLVTALRNAGLEEEANIIEKQSFVTMAVQEPVSQIGKRNDSEVDGISAPAAQELSHEQPKSFELLRQPSGGYIMRHGPITVFVKPDVPKGLNVLLQKYAEMLLVLRSTSQAKDTFHKLKLYLSDYCEELSIRSCSTLSDVIDILIKKLKIYIFNIETLSAVASCDYFAIKCSEMKACVEKYKHHLDEFLSKASVKEFMGTLETEITNHSIVEPVTLKLNETKIDDTLKTLKKLVYHFFGNCSKALAHSDTGEGCVCITWLVPTSLVPTLKTMAKKHSQEYLASQGVLELVIGLRIAPNEVNIEELQAKIDSYQRMGRARDLAISTIQKRNEELESKLKAVMLKAKSDYKVMFEQQQVQVKEVEKEKCELETTIEMLQEKASDLKAKLQADNKTYQEKVAAKDEEFKITYNRMCAFREKCGELEKVVTVVQRENSDLLDKCAVLERENKMLQKQKFKLEEKLGDLDRDVEIFEQKEKESELKMLQKQKFDQEEKLGDLEREVETFKQKEKDSAEVGVASVVQEDVRYHTTDGDKSEGTPLPITEPNSQLESCVDAFKSGNKQIAEQLLTPHLHPAAIRTKFFLGDRSANTATAKVSLLHLAAYWGWKDIAILLVSVHNCDANWKDDAGQTPLYYSVYNGHLELVKYFITEQLLDPMDRNKNGSTLLHLACENGHLTIVQYLISEVHCIPSCVNNIGNTPLHLACENGHLNIIQDLISELHCNPSCVNNIGNTPLHLACENGYLNIVLYLIGEVHCNPSCVDKIGTTPLHKACLCNHAHVVQYLLSTGCVNPLAEDQVGNTPLSFATGKHDIIKLLQPYIDCSRDYPVHTFTKLILTGDSGAGKTTIAQHIILASSTASRGRVARWLLPANRVPEVEHLTAGFVQHHIKGQLGNFVVFDFAGQQEYYSSHATVLELVMRKSAAVFFCMIDLTKSEEKICESLQYWLTFIDNASSTAEGTSHVVIVGSHADQVTSLRKIKEKSSLLQKIVTSRVKRQEYAGYVTMDCRYANTAPSRQLISILTNSKEAITASQPAISCYCHVLYAFLRNKLDVVGCTLQDLISAIAKENDLCFPNDPSVLTELLTILSDKGFILFIQHRQSSWIFVKTAVLMNDINRTLFAPHHFKEHHDLASNTGIVPTSNLWKVFPQYNPDMLLSFLVSLEFCQPVHSLVLNLQTTLSRSTADLLFFPGLIQSERPDSLIQLGTLEFGWCLGCMDPHEFFSSHFLHVLLLSVAYKYPLASPSHSHSSVSGLQRMCTIWRNGISWRDNNDITTVIELLDNNQWVLVAMSCDHTSPIQHAELRSSLIALVLHLQQEHCPLLNVSDFLVSPGLVCRQYPIDSLPDSDLFHIHHVAQSILLHNSVVLSHKDGSGFFSLNSLPFEPYHVLSPSLVHQLHNPNMANQRVPVHYLHEVQRICQQHFSKMMLLVYKELREQIDKLSIFAGRNPLELAELKEEDLTSSVGLTTGAGDASSILSIDDLVKVKKSLRSIVDWKPLGLELGLSYTTLQCIDRNQHGMIEDCKTEMLAAWLQQMDKVSQYGVPSWFTLQTALRNIGEDELDLAELKEEEITKIKMSLRKVLDWKTLGLELGLLYPTLHKIEVEQHGMIDKCKTKMLAAWLQKEDNVSQYGVPSWSTLQTALRNIGEDKLEVAELKEEDLSSIIGLTTGAGDASSILSINDLFKVKMSLRKVVDWKTLGLELGLLYPTLEMIKKEQHGWIDKCKTEMLAAWLKQEYNVSQYGVPSLSTLQTALRNIGENKLEVVELKEEDISSTAGLTTGAGDASSILSIDDLFKVKKSLRPISDWQSLGLALGLLYPTLKKIGKEQHGMIDTCKTEMLAAWLQQQDSVNQHGVPSWSTLQTALRNIGEDEVASKIN